MIGSGEKKPKETKNRKSGLAEKRSENMSWGWSGVGLLEMDECGLGVMVLLGGGKS